MEEEKNGTVSSDLENGLRKANQVARNAKRIASAAAKAAGGNYIGAAKDALQSGAVRKSIAVLLIMAFLLTFITFFAAPLTLYEGVKSYGETVRERWLEAYYASDSNRALAALRATLSGSWDIISDIWGAVLRQVTKNDPVTQDADEMTADDIALFGSKESLRSVYVRKLDAVCGKLKARSEMIREAIEASASGSVNNAGTINGWVYQKLFCVRDYAQYGYLEDTRNVIYGGVQTSVSTQNLKQRDAVKLIGLYSAMYNCNPDLIRPYALIKWLGYYDGGAGTPASFSVGDAVSCSVAAWRGDFMPMYLMEEERNNPDQDYSANKCAAADILLYVSSSPLGTLTPMVQKEEIQTQTYELREGFAPQWRLMSPETYASWGNYANGEMPASWPDTGSEYGRWTAYRGPLSYEEMCTAYAAGELGWYVVMDYCTYWEPVVIIEYDYTLTYLFSASVSVRSTEAISRLAGFYEKTERDVVTD